MTGSPAPSPGPLRVAVLASGGGSNLQALLDGEREAGVWEIVLVASDRPSSGALERAARAGVSREIIAVEGASEDGRRPSLAEALEGHAIDAVLLAGYLRRVPTDVVRAYRGRILNVHPALLPAFGGRGMYGMHVHEAVLRAGVRVTGVTVHMVDEGLDEGAILAQWPVPVLPGDDAESLAARVLAVEHRLYPRVADAVLARLRSGQVVEPGRPVFAVPGAAFLAGAHLPELEAQLSEALSPPPPSSSHHATPGRPPAP